MTNREKIEVWLSSNQDIVYWEWKNDINDNLIVYVVDWSAESGIEDALYDLSVNEDDTITCLRHVRNG